MGACMSSNSEETEQKKRSQKIDKDLEEDSKRLRRECKILLLGMWFFRGWSQEIGVMCRANLTLNSWIDEMTNRIRRERQINDCEADEDYSLEGLLGR